ncbi:MAG TPA: BBE domain-containing protein, partial [Anaerolineaceae bacterium]|nr:BBE domain-containing protein [Anaerolineaceae bacterium]
DVGAVGYTLGGGWGWLTRKYGLSADNVLRFEVVTPDGELRTASENENPDLFWALRGGGGGFGVVTGMEIRLYPVAQVYAGNLHYPAAMAKEVFQRFEEWVSDTPDEMSASIVLINYPPLPDLPPFLQGQSFVIVRGCYLGEPEEGEKLVSFWRDWQQPAIDGFKVLPFSQADQISQDPPGPIPFMGTGGWLRDLSEETADTLIQFTLPQSGPPLLIFTEVRLAGGVVARAAPDTNAYSNREERFNWFSLALVMAPEMAEAVGKQFAALQQALGAHLSGKVYMNFVERQETAQRTRDGFSEAAFQRLREIKAKYDPENRFRYAFDIQPA